MKQFAMKSSQNILMNGFFPQQNSKMKDKTIDIFMRKNLNRSEIWAKMKSPRPVRHETFSFMHSNHLQQWKFSTEVPTKQQYQHRTQASR